jgi:uncharacterized membrane protein YfhO
MTTEFQNEPSAPISLRSRRFLALAPWFAFTALIIFSAVEGSLRLLFWIFAVSSAVGAIAMQLLYHTHYAAGEVTAIIVSLLFYAGITFVLMRSRRRWIAYLLFVVLVGSLLWSAGAFVLLHFMKW